jgi:hypothetical protein
MNGQLKTPDVTAAQIIAIVQPFVTATIGLLVAFGIEMTDAQQVAIIAFTGAMATMISTVLFLADAIIRSARAKAMSTHPPPQTEGKVAA